MIIRYGFGNDYYGDMVIENYPNLHTIVVKCNSLQNVKSLKICNCEKLKMIIIEDGEYYGGSFFSVANVIMESISEIIL